MAFRILTIDGGGVRGIFPAHLLASLVRELSIDPANTFDLIAGTSTGAIIAAAAATGFPLDKLARLYEEHAPRIFRYRRSSIKGIVRSSYAVEPLKKLLGDVYGDKTMADSQTRLMLPATDASNGNVFVTKSPYLPGFVRDKDIRIADAVMASCAAPAFFDPTQVKEYLLTDGGLWANNPSLIAYVEAVGKLEQALDDVRLLSLGTGTGHRYYDVGKIQSRLWGLGTGWNGRQLVDLVFNLQTRAATNMATLLLKDRYLRVSFDENGSLSLDDPADIPRLKAKASEAFTYQFQAIKTFLES